MKFTLIERFKIIREFLRLNRKAEYTKFTCVNLSRAINKITGKYGITMQRVYFSKCFSSKYRNGNILKSMNDRKRVNLRKLAFVKFVILFTFNLI